MEADFSGWATKAGIKCSDGRTIMSGAFKHQDKMQVPLVWQHGHTDVENVLGHAILENRGEEGVYCFGFFNDSPKAVHAAGLLGHKDIKHLSIWANQLVERASMVLHGTIREVSLVLSGANPGAVIENVSIRHSDEADEELEDEAIIYTDAEIEIKHADTGGSDGGGDGTDGPTVEDVIATMNDEQAQVLHFMVGAALDAKTTPPVQQDNLNDGSKEGSTMANVFEKDAKDSGPVISHDDMKGIFAAADKIGSLKEAMEAYAEEHLEHGITDIEALFPEATQLTAAPEWITRRTEWVAPFLGGVRKTPFSRIKTATADLTFEDARAKGYIKGNMKKEQFFTTSRRETTPQTVYKKQKLDRDDIIDITDFDVVSWIKGEMRFMLEEEIARAALIGDGRDVDDEDKIDETHIRPIAKDDDFYTIQVNVNIDDASSSVQEIVDAFVMARSQYKGSGSPTFYTTEYYISRFLLLKDTLGRRIYTSLDQLASELRVTSIVPVEVLEDEPDIIAIVVNTVDYAIGADKGGQVAMFDDFDIDYNQYKYLIETRCSGALTKPRSAMVLKRRASGDVLLANAATPSFDEDTGVITLGTSTHFQWKDGEGTNLSDGAQAALDVGETMTVVAVADSGYYFATSEDDEWTFTRP